MASQVTAGPAKLERPGLSLSIFASLQRTTVLRYTAAIAITAAFALLRYSLDRFFGDTSIYSFFYASLVLSAWYLGFGPSIVSLLAGTATAAYFFAPPRGSFEIHQFRHINGLVVHLIVGAYLAYLIHWLKRDIARRQKAEAELLASQEAVQAHQAELAHMARLTLMGEMSASLAHELNQPLHQRGITPRAASAACSATRIPTAR